MVEHICCSCADPLRGELTQLLAELASSPRRNHQSPVPYLSGVAYGLLGPVANNELPGPSGG